MIKDLKIFKESDFITSKWSGGETTQMLIFPEDSSYKDKSFKWRISSATVELEESDFTKLEGVYRYITTLNGNLKLTHDYDKFIELKPFEIYEFKGGIDTHSYGKVKDFNLMLANNARGELNRINIDDDVNLSIANYSNEMQICAFYTYDEIINLIIENDVIILNPNELMTFKIEPNNLINISISAKNNSKILYAKLVP